MLFVAEYVERSLQRFIQGMSLLVAFQANGNAIRQTCHPVTGIVVLDNKIEFSYYTDVQLSRRRDCLNMGPIKSKMKWITDRYWRVLSIYPLAGNNSDALRTCPAQRGINREISRKPRFSHKSPACFRKNPDFSSSPPRNSFSRRRDRTFGKIGSNSFRLKSRHRSITISSVIYEPERAARGETSRARAHVKSIFCHTLTRCCPNPCGIYDETLNDRSLLLAFTNEQVSLVLTDVSIVSFGCWRRSATDMYLISPHATRHIHLIFDRAIRHAISIFRRATQGK